MRVQGEALTMRPDDWADALTDKFKSSLTERALAWEAHNLPAPPVDDILGIFLTLLPPAAPNALDTEIGPFYDTAGVRTLLGGITKQAIDGRRRQHTILALKTTDGQWVYPTFQFTDNYVEPTLIRTIQAFRDAPAWSAALWFVTPNPDLDDMTPVDWARAGHSSDTLLASAQRTIREWQ